MKREVLHLSADVNHAARGLEEARLTYMVARFFAMHDALDELLQFCIGRTLSHQSIEIVIELGKEAGADLAVRGDADTRAVSAKRMGYRRDDADFSNTIIEGIAPGSFAHRILGKLFHRTEAIQRGK